MQIDSATRTLSDILKVISSESVMATARAESLQKELDTEKTKWALREQELTQRIAELEKENQALKLRSARTG